MSLASPPLRRSARLLHAHQPPTPPTTPSKKRRRTTPDKPIQLPTPEQTPRALRALKRRRLSPPQLDQKQKLRSYHPPPDDQPRGKKKRKENKPTLGLSAASPVVIPSSPHKPPSPLLEIAQGRAPLDAVDIGPGFPSFTVSETFDVLVATTQNDPDTDQPLDPPQPEPSTSEEQSTPPPPVEESQTPPPEVPFTGMQIVLDEAPAFAPIPDSIPDPDLDCAQQQQQWYEPMPPRIEKSDGVWKVACSWRVWEILRRYTPDTIRAVVAQQANDYYATHGGYPDGYLGFSTQSSDSADDEYPEDEEDDVEFDENGCAYAYEDEEDEDEYDGDEAYDGEVGDGDCSIGEVAKRCKEKEVHMSEGGGKWKWKIGTVAKSDGMEVDSQSIPQPTPIPTPPSTPPLTFAYSTCPSPQPQLPVPSFPSPSPQLQSPFPSLPPTPPQPSTPSFTTLTTTFPASPSIHLPFPPPRLSSIRVHLLRNMDIDSRVGAAVGRGTPVDRERRDEWARGKGLCVGVGRGCGMSAGRLRREEWCQDVCMVDGSGADAMNMSMNMNMNISNTGGNGNEGTSGSVSALEAREWREFLESLDVPGVGETRSVGSTPTPSFLNPPSSYSPSPGESFASSSTPPPSTNANSGLNLALIPYSHSPALAAPSPFAPFAAAPSPSPSLDQALSFVPSPPLPPSYTAPLTFSSPSPCPSSPSPSPPSPSSPSPTSPQGFYIPPVPASPPPSPFAMALDDVGMGIGMSMSMGMNMFGMGLGVGMGIGMAMGAMGVGMGLGVGVDVEFVGGAGAGSEGGREEEGVGVGNGGESGHGSAGTTSGSGSGTSVGAAANASTGAGEGSLEFALG